MNDSPGADELFQKWDGPLPVTGVKRGWILWI